MIKRWNSRLSSWSIFLIERAFYISIYFFNPSETRENTTKLVRIYRWKSWTIWYTPNIIQNFSDFHLENPFFVSVFPCKKPYFCCIFTRFARIKKNNTDLKSPFNEEYGSLTQLGVWSLYHCLFVYYRSKVDSQEMALQDARKTHALPRFKLVFHSGDRRS